MLCPYNARRFAANKLASGHIARNQVVSGLRVS